MSRRKTKSLAPFTGLRETGRTPLSRSAKFGVSLRAELLEGFERAASEPDVRDFGDACCYVIGRLEQLAGELGTIALWDKLRAEKRASPIQPNDLRQLQFFESPRAELVVGFASAEMVTAALSVGLEPCDLGPEEPSDEDREEVGR